MIEKRVVSAGHICLDITPDLSGVPAGEFSTLIQPGTTIRASGVNLRGGGASVNTGLALQKLGVPVQIIGKIGDDLFGAVLQEWIKSQNATLAEGLIIDPAAATSYTLIIDTPGIERSFIHYQGANDVFYASDLPRGTLEKADLFHFGYPSLMRSVYRGDGGELVSIMRRAQKVGMTTSLDVALPDLMSEAGQVDWHEIMANSLPWVDIFTPNAAELSFLLDRPVYLDHCGDVNCPFLDWITLDYLHALSNKVLAYGVKVLLIKLGHRGIFLRTGDEDAWGKTGRGLAGLGEEWHDREIWAPSYQVEVRVTTGAGDSATAGLLTGLLIFASPETATRLAAAAGAASVEGADAVGGLTSWEQLLDRVNSGWATSPVDFQTSGDWVSTENGLWQKDQKG
jgi:sugar/nucleoside kinase (ribokinase family)